MHSVHRGISALSLLPDAPVGLGHFRVTGAISQAVSIDSGALLTFNDLRYSGFLLAWHLGLVPLRKCLRGCP